MPELVPELCLKNRKFDLGPKFELTPEMFRNISTKKSDSFHGTGFLLSREIGTKYFVPGIPGTGQVGTSYYSSVYTLVLQKKCRKRAFLLLVHGSLKHIRYFKL